MRQDRKLAINSGASQFVWEKYNSVGTTNYIWNRYSCNSSTTYYWDKHSTNSTTTYYWNQYQSAISSVTWNATSQLRMGTMISHYLGWSVTFSDNSTLDTVTTGMGGGYLDAVCSTNGTTVTVSVGRNVSIPSGYTSSAYSTAYYSIFSVPDDPTTPNTMHTVNLWRLAHINSQGFYCWIPILTNGKKVSSAVGSVGTYNFDLSDFNCSVSKGSLIGTVNSTSSSAYPNNGAQDGYFYEYSTSSIAYSKGSTSYGRVNSSSSSTYPNGGRHSDGYWYSNRSSSTTYSQGSTQYSDVTSTNRNAYPDNNYSGSYWYKYSTSTTTYSKGATSYGQVKNKDINTYPSNGRHTDGYWYVLIS